MIDNKSMISLRLINIHKNKLISYKKQPQQIFTKPNRTLKKQFNYPEIVVILTKKLDSEQVKNLSF